MLDTQHVWLVSGRIKHGNLITTLGIFTRLDKAIERCMPFTTIECLADDVIECSCNDTDYITRITRHTLQA